jgi:Transglutaminase-like superfamily
VKGTLPLRWRVEAAASAAVIPPLLRLSSFARLARWLGRGRAGRAARASLDDAALADWIDRLLGAAPGPWRKTCLRRAAVLYHLLRRAGRPVELWLGVKRNDGALAAHAWLVRDGRPYLEPDVEIALAHEPIARFPEKNGR